ncbi:hypothetical protein DFH07DRAFT_771847 [Mycena maculata]|uniref:Uncharacterized protein n=1 Tax=Mycena maculata TaxID=230809 RepID=A0AAD7J9W7_9AGAR|nr:hypothetical protein DFH07DRAFT_771847 [Mycena maculata]
MFVPGAGMDPNVVKKEKESAYNATRAAGSQYLAECSEIRGNSPALRARQQPAALKSAYAGSLMHQNSGHGSNRAAPTLRSCREDCGPWTKHSPLPNPTPRNLKGKHINLRYITCTLLMRRREGTDTRAKPIESVEDGSADDDVGTPYSAQEKERRRKSPAKKRPERAEIPGYNMTAPSHDIDPATSDNRERASSLRNCPTERGPLENAKA